LADHGAAAGTAYREVVLKNTSTRACSLFGYPGVSFVDARGTQIGAPAPRASSAASPGPALVTLAPGATASALLAYHDVYVATFPGCAGTTAAGIKVYPPNQTAAVVVPTTMMVCANPAATGTAEVSAVTAGSGLNP
jgi:hypothetical protein